MWQNGGGFTVEGVEMQTQAEMVGAVALCARNYSPEHTGIAPYVTALANYLQPCLVLTTQPHYPNPANFVSHRVSIDTISPKVHRVPILLSNKSNQLSRAVAELRLGIEFAKFDIGRLRLLVAVSPALLASFILMLRIRLTSKAKFVFWVQDLYAVGLAEFGKSKWQVKVFRWIERFMFKYSDVVVLIHPALPELLKDFYGYEGKNLRVIRNWNLQCAPENVPLQEAFENIRRGHKVFDMSKYCVISFLS